MEISDIQLAEELKKYRSANKGKVSFRLMSIDMGYYETFVNNVVHTVVKKRQSLREKTRETIVHYLSKKGWFHPSGLPKDFGSPMGFKKVDEETVKELLEEKVTDTLQEMNIANMTDAQLKKELRDYKYSRNIPFMTIGEEIGMSKSYVSQFTLQKARIEKPLKKRIIAYLIAKGHKATIPSKPALPPPTASPAAGMDLDKAYSIAGFVNGVLALPLSQEKKESILIKMFSEDKIAL